jgi:hypothetical protein
MVDYVDVDSGMHNQPLIEGINANFRALLAGQGNTPVRITPGTSVSIDATDEVLLVDATAGAVVLTLPAIATFVLRRRVLVKHILAAHNVTLNPQPTEQIDQASAGVGLSLNSVNDQAELVTDGTRWYRVG